MNTKADRFYSGFMEKVEVTDSCWLWRGARRGGRNNHYGNYRGKMAHRVAYTLFCKEEIPQGKIILHTCDNPLCVNPDHLKLGTLSDNAIDMYDKGRSPNTVITPEVARRIKSLANSGVKQSVIASHLEISRASVCNIVNGDRWNRA